jgi:hypothetical protein
MPKKTNERKAVKAWGLKHPTTGELVSCATPDTYEIQTMYPTCMKAGYKLVPVLITEITK